MREFGYAGAQAPEGHLGARIVNVRNGSVDSGEFEKAVGKCASRSAGVASTASSPMVAVFAIWHILHALRPDLEVVWW